MPKVKNPLFSLRASGTIADTLTYQHQTGINIARSKPDPSNTDPSEAQTQQRALIASIGNMYKSLKTDTYSLGIWERIAQRNKTHISAEAIFTQWSIKTCRQTLDGSSIQRANVSVGFSQQYQRWQEATLQPLGPSVRGPFYVSKISLVSANWVIQLTNPVLQINRPYAIFLSSDPGVEVFDIKIKTANSPYDGVQLLPTILKSWL